MSIAKEHDDDVEFAVDVYENALVENLRLLLEGGRVPGVHAPSRRELRSFFRSTEEGYWRTLAAADPAEAESELTQWEAIDADQPL